LNPRPKISLIEHLHAYLTFCISPMETPVRRIYHQPAQGFHPDKPGGFTGAILLIDGRSRPAGWSRQPGCLIRQPVQIRDLQLHLVSHPFNEWSGTSACNPTSTYPCRTLFAPLMLLNLEFSPDFPFGISLFDFLSLVIMFPAAGKTELHFGLSPDEIYLQGHQG
jgi:hypothetical protein